MGLATQKYASFVLKGCSRMVIVAGAQTICSGVRQTFLKADLGCLESHCYKIFTSDGGRELMTQDDA